MPNSQIEMVVQDDSQHGGWRVCGEFEEDPGGRVHVYVVVRQGDVVACGSDVVTGQEWQFGMTPEGGQLVSGEDQTAIASAVAIARKSSGLEVFTWAQRVRVLPDRKLGDEPPPLDEGTPAASPGGRSPWVTPSPRPWLSASRRALRPAPAASPTPPT